MDVRGSQNMKDDVRLFIFSSKSLSKVILERNNCILLSSSFSISFYRIERVPVLLLQLCSLPFLPFS